MADNSKIDFSSATSIPFSTEPSPLSHKGGGGALDGFPNAKDGPSNTREGTGPAWNDTGKGENDFSGRNIPPVVGNVNERKRPVSTPQAFERK